MPPHSKTSARAPYVLNQLQATRGGIENGIEIQPKAKSQTDDALRCAYEDESQKDLSILLHNHLHHHIPVYAAWATCLDQRWINADGSEVQDDNGSHLAKP